MSIVRGRRDMQEKRKSKETVRVKVLRAVAASPRCICSRFIRLYILFRTRLRREAYVPRVN